MTKELILVHGRSQERKDSVELKADWIKSLKLGLAEHGLALPIAEEEIRFPYYGDTLYDLVGGSEDPAEVILRGQEQAAPFALFLTDVLTEVQERYEISDSEIATLQKNALNIRPEIVERSVLNWGWVQAIMMAIDKHVPGGSGAAIALGTWDVYQYLTNLAIRDRIETGVSKALSAGKPAVVVSHSLGTVISYNLLRRDGATRGWHVPLFVTLGSPLGVQKIRKMLKPLTHPVCIEKWFNAMDPDDVVSLYPLDSDRFPITPAIENKTDIKNDTRNQHGISGYLKDPTVARKIYDALVAP